MEHFRREARMGDGSLHSALIEVANKFNVPYLVAVLPLGMIDSKKTTVPEEIRDTPCPSVAGVGYNALWQNFAKEVAILCARAIEESGDDLPKLLTRLHTEGN